MLGMFCGSDCKTNEEYKKRVKGRIIIFIGIVVLGLITLLATVIGNRYFNLKLSENMLSTYSGFGTGLTVVAVSYTHLTLPTIYSV